MINLLEAKESLPTRYLKRYNQSDTYLDVTSHKHEIPAFPEKLKLLISCVPGPHGMHGPPGQFGPPPGQHQPGMMPPHMQGGGPPNGPPRMNGPPMGPGNMMPPHMMGGPGPDMLPPNHPHRMMSPHGNPQMNPHGHPQHGPPPPGMGGPGMPGGPMMGPPGMGGKVYPPNQPMIFNPQNPNAPPIHPCGVCHREVQGDSEEGKTVTFWFKTVSY